MRLIADFKACVALAALVAAGVSLGVELPLADDAARAKAEAIRAKMTLEEKVSLLGGCATMNLKAWPKLGIPREWAMSDCTHAVKPESGRENWPYVPGVDNRSVILPPLSAVAMTWNRELAARHGTAIGEQMRAVGKDQILGPGVNILRTPLCGRNWEYMTEDPYLAAELVVPYVRAAQRQGVAATVKHFCVNNQELARQTVDTVVDERTLHEIYLPAFKAALIDGGALCVMTAYNKYNGQHTSENAYLLRGLLRERWGYKGCVVSDWGGQHSTVQAALNGADIEMDSGRQIHFFTDYYGTGKFPLVEAVRRGEVPEANVDDMVGRVLFMMAKTGFLDGVQPKGSRFTESQHRTQVEIGEESITLLKNDRGVLPLRKEAMKKVVVLGERANQKYTRLGGACEGMPEKETTFFEALRAYLGDKVEVVLLPLGNEVSEAGGFRRIPNAQLETYRSKSTDAFVQRAWEVYRWNPGEEWRDDKAILDGYADYPTGRCLNALRYVAKMRAEESGDFFFGLAHDKQIGSATIKLDGVDVYASFKSMMNKVRLEKDRVYTVTVDVDGCYGEGDSGFVFGMMPVHPVDVKARERAIAGADAVIVFAGTMMGRGRALESEGMDMPSMAQPEGYDEDIAALAKTDVKNLVVLNRSGTPLEMPWADAVPTLVQVPYLGQDSAALPRILFGEVNPSGKLACTFPRHYADLPVARPEAYNAERILYRERFYVGYRWFDHRGIKPLFPFGYGLSYTTFRYSDAKAAPCAACGGWKVSVTVANTGKVAGKESVQLYVAAKGSKVERCVKDLKGFAKTKLLAPGEGETLEMVVTPRELAYYDEFLHRWRAPAGEYELAVGASSADLRGHVAVTLEKDVVFGD